MANKTPVPLMGRLAVQLKLVTKDQLAQALQNTTASGGKLGDVMVEMGLVNRKQLQKLEQVQRDVVAKHRAKQAAAAGGAPATPPAAPPAQPTPDPVHELAQGAARAASPMHSEAVLELEQPASSGPELELADPAAPSTAASRRTTSPRSSSRSPVRRRRRGRQPSP